MLRLCDFIVTVHAEAVAKAEAASAISGIRNPAQPTTGALGSALLAGKESLDACGGKMLLFQSHRPVLGLGVLPDREKMRL